MAKQTDDTRLTGSIGGLVCYKMYGAYFVRTKSSLTAKRFWKDRAFEGSRKSASLLARASALASGYYQTYPAEKKRRGLFNEMTGKVKLWLQEGKGNEEALLLLKEQYGMGQQKRKRERRGKRPKAGASKKREALFIVSIGENFTIHKRRSKTKKQHGPGPPGVLHSGFL